MAGLHIVFDCTDPDLVARFWMAAMPGYEFPHGPPEGFASWDEWADAQGIPEDQRPKDRTLVDRTGERPTIFFNHVPGSKTGKNRLHLDIKVAEGLPADERRATIRAEADRIEKAGATVDRVVDEPQKFWVVMRDPEDNEFCVI